MVCSSCGRKNDAAARFCDACGAQLGAPPAGVETRKVVTVVFTDVVDSTALGERLDPESLRRVMWRYFDAMQATLERHGGTVEKFIGDAIVAVFGVPAVHEDDALRAIRAAFEMRELLERVNESLAGEYGVRIGTRTGVNTGEVIVGDTVGDQKLATGDAVNVAARLEQAAQPGEVLIGKPTYQLVRDAVVVEAAPAVEAKGKSQPLAAWRLLGIRPDVPAFARPIVTPFVGRSRELDELRFGFQTAVRESSCCLATIVGPPGIGKSRLAREVVRSFESVARVVVGRCVAYGEGITYLPLAEVVREVAGPDPEPTLRELLTNVERGPIATRLIMGAIGANDEPGSPEETAWAFRRLFETLALSRPLVVVVDDIHWAEPALLDLLEYVLGFSIGAPILLLCLARPDLFDARPSWSAPRSRATLVSLSPLSTDESEDLVEGLLHDVDVSPALRERIVGAAEGNPLFVEQMLAMLADDPDTAHDTVPATIHALLAARIERLEPGERAVLLRASVEGRLFHRGTVAQLLPSQRTDGLGSILLALTRKELLRPDRSLFEGDDGFRFNHVLIRDVAYASMPKDLRADLHLRLASWLEARAGRQPTGQDELVGYHLEQAYLTRAELGQASVHARAAALKGGYLLGRAGRRADRASSRDGARPRRLDACAAGTRCHAGDRSTGARRVRTDLQRRRPRGCMAAAGTRRPWCGRQGRAAPRSSAWPESRRGFRRHAAPDRSLERGGRLDAVRPDARRGSAGVPRRGACLGPRARAGRGRGGRTARRPVPLRPPRPVRRGARPARALQGDLSRARHRVRARGGAHGGRRDGDARRRREGSRAGTPRRNPGGVGHARVALRRPLSHAARPRPHLPGTGRGRAGRAGAGKEDLRGARLVEDGARARARASRRDGGSGRSRPRSSRLHCPQRRHHSTRRRAGRRG